MRKSTSEQGGWGCKLCLHTPSISLILTDTAAAFRQYLSIFQELVWACMERMIEYIRQAVSSPLAEVELEGVLAGLVVDGGLELPLACHMIVYIRFQMSL